MSLLDGKMRKLLGNLKEKRFYNENKTESKRKSPTSLKIYKKSGEADRDIEKLRQNTKNMIVIKATLFRNLL